MEEVEQGAADDVPNSEDFMVAENNMILDTLHKTTNLFQFETPDNSNQELSWFKDTFTFLSPATRKFHDSIEKATKLSENIYNTQKLKEVQKKHNWIHWSQSKSWFSLWESSCR